MFTTCLDTINSTFWAQTQQDARVAGDRLSLRLSPKIIPELEGRRRPRPAVRLGRRYSPLTAVYRGVIARQQYAARSRNRYRTVPVMTKSSPGLVARWILGCWPA